MSTPLSLSFHRFLRVACLACTLSFLSSLAEAADPIAGDDFSGSGTVFDDDGSGDPCGDLLLTGDLTFDNAIVWQYGGVVPPYYGAFAEKYRGDYEVCALALFFTQIGNQIGRTLDAYVWDDDGGVPGAVHCMESGIDPGPVAFWPSVSHHEAGLSSGCCVADDWWCGWWGNWPGELSGWFQAEHHTGPAGFPFTNIAPGLGYPTGWHNVSIIWGPHQSLGIGAYVNPCEPTPTRETSWGAIKGLYLDAVSHRR